MHTKTFFFIDAYVPAKLVWLCEWMRSYARLRQVQQPGTGTCRPKLLILSGIIFLDPTFFPRLSYSVGEKLLGANTQSRLFGEDWTRFFSQYFRTVPTSVISYACFVNEYSG